MMCMSLSKILNPFFAINHPSRLSCNIRRELVSISHRAYFGLGFAQVHALTDGTLDPCKDMRFKSLERLERLEPLNLFLTVLK